MKPKMFINVRGVTHEVSREFACYSLLAARRDGYKICKFFSHKVNSDNLCKRVSSYVRLIARKSDDVDCICVFQYTMNKVSIL